MERGSGVLLPVFSLPNAHGIGTFGLAARQFIDFLVRGEQRYWQMLPLNPTSYGDSPYQSFSAFALNPYFIDLDILVEEQLLKPSEIDDVKDGAVIDYGWLYFARFKTLRRAYERFLALSGRDKLEKFAAEQEEWLPDYAAFMVIKEIQNGDSWQEWPEEYRFYSKSLVEEVSAQHVENYWFYIFLQFEAFRQYKKLRAYAEEKKISIIGDIPIYVALDSADVWSDPDSFQLDADRRPIKVAGVPPDYFSATGQLWGNPIYDYEKMRSDGFSWWKLRTRKCAELYDVLRIDHFRGIDEYWAVPYGEETAINGEWVKGPGYELIEAVSSAAPDMQFIAEDLGLLTPSVLELKRRSGWPGMKIFEFAFDGGYDNAFLPHNYETNCVAYIGTHDNDTLQNFIATNQSQHNFMKEYLHIDRTEDIHETMIGTLMRSAADVVILNLQDLLHQDAKGRINVPGTVGTNWVYRLPASVLNDEALLEHLTALTRESGR